MTQKRILVPTERIENKILLIRGQKVIIGTDLADLYGVTTKRLYEQVRRNKARFPEDFMFQLTKDELGEVAAKCGHLSNLRFSFVRPYAFTEHGTIMAANVLNSGQAIEISLFVVRAFIKLRETLATHKQLTHKLPELERKLASHDQAIISIVDAIKELMAPPEPKDKHPIGFPTVTDYLLTQINRERRTPDSFNRGPACRTKNFCPAQTLVCYVGLTG